MSAKVRTLHWSVPPIELAPVSREGGRDRYFASSLDSVSDVRDLRVRPTSRNLDDTFVTNLNHELRTPLAAIIGLTHVLGEEVDGDVLEYVDLIRDSGRRLQGTIERLLESVETSTRSKAA